MRIMRNLLIAAALTFTATAAPVLSFPASAQTAALIDINSAGKPALEALKGVGPARADAIIIGRPYKGKDDLVTKKIIPENIYKDIKDKIIAKQKS